MAVGIVIVVIILVALLVHSCQSNATKSALEDYVNSVSSLNSQSVANGKQLFTELAQASAAGNPQSVQNEINQVLSDEKKVYSKAQAVSVPDQAKDGSAQFLMALKMRVDGITNISNEIQPALATSASQAEVNAIAGETERLYASDIIYKDYAAPKIVAALNAAGGRTSPINGGQFVPNVEWVSPTFLAQTLGVSTPSQTSGKPTPGLHGHSLTSVSVNGTTLQPGGATNTLPTSATTFVLTFNNGGTNDEHNVKCKVSINGSSVSGTATVPETFAGKNAQCTVKLNAAPPAGTQTVVATIEKVLGEKNLDNNTLTYTITFQ